MKYNKDIDWIIFTDDKTSYDYPVNVKVIYTDFSALKNLIQEKLDINVSNIKPYKLCDFKPFYGLIFEDYIGDHLFWGHCDFDCIFGRLTKFISDSMLQEYDKLFFLGHLSLYKNSSKMRELIRDFFNSIENISLMLAKNYPYQLDEVVFIKYLSEKKIPIFSDDSMIADVFCLKKPFYITHSEIKKEHNDTIRLVSTYDSNRGMLFSYHQGILDAYWLGNTNKINHKEYMYVHFQKRKLTVTVEPTDADNFFVVPNKIIPSRKVKEKILLTCGKSDLFYKEFFKIKWNNLKNRFKRRV